MNEKLSKVCSVFKKDGVGKASRKVIRYASGAVRKKIGFGYKSDFKKNRGTYEFLIKEAVNGDSDRILIWRSSFGWNVPLFQRPQHVSNSLSKHGCLVFYEVTSMTDEVKAIEKKSDGLYLVNFENSYISDLLFSYTDASDKPKYLQFYSTDWTLPLDYVKSFISKGYKILYEYIDDVNPALAGTKELPKNIADKYEYAMEDSDNVLMVTTADLLREDAIKHRGWKNLVFSTNGVDYDFFQKLDSGFEFEKEFNDVLQRGKPVIGYYGAMARWLDYELIKKIDATGEFSVVLFGIRYDDSLDSSGITELDNVFFFGPREYSKLKNYASKIDVLTIPFVINDITKATSPLKLFEYMALHKPIVTTAMNECIKYATTMVAYDHDEFISLLRKAYELRNNASYMENLDREARENSWDMKTEGIIGMLENAEKS